MFLFAMISINWNIHEQQHKKNELDENKYDFTHMLWQARNYYSIIFCCTQHINSHSRFQVEFLEFPFKTNSNLDLLKFIENKTKKTKKQRFNNWPYKVSFFLSNWKKMHFLQSHLIQFSSDSASHRSICVGNFNLQCSGHYEQFDIGVALRFELNCDNDWH